ncbi:MAG: hypothetical protein EOP48_16670, partial [Sphingobacteriales bacterium]
KTLKATLECFTPFAQINGYRDSSNVKSLSEFIYLDIDNLSDAAALKQSLIQSHSNIITLIAITPSNKGLSILVRVRYDNTQEEVSKGLQQAIEHVKSLFPDTIQFDPACKDIARANCITFDPEVYFNDKAETVNIPTITEFTEKKSQVKPRASKNQNLLLPIDEVLKVLKLKTEVEVSDIVDFNPVDGFSEVYIPKVITDGQKRKVYFAIICNLKLLNPNADDIYIYSFIHWVNNNYAKPRMNHDELMKHTKNILKQIKDGVIVPVDVIETRTKSVHFAKDCGLSGNDKRTIAAKINGNKTKADTINAIIRTKKEMAVKGLKINRATLSKYSGVGLNTVKKYWDAEPIDIYEVIEDITANIEDYSWQKLINTSHSELF